MKNVILIFVGMTMILYSLAIGSTVYSQVSRKNELEKTVSRVVEATLTDCYKKCSAAQTRQQLLHDLAEAFGSERQMDVRIRALDMEKGILSVAVTETYWNLNGKQERIDCEKTAIVEKSLQEETRVTVEFWVEEELYKVFTLLSGEDCPIPKLPGDLFIGWERYGAEGSGPVNVITNVEEDRTYVAITE